MKKLILNQIFLFEYNLVKNTKVKRGQNKLVISDQNEDKPKLSKPKTGNVLWKAKFYGKIQRQK